MRSGTAISSLRSGATWILAGSAVYSACQWALPVVVARTLDPEAVGQFALALAITAPLFLLTNLQLRTVLVTDVESRHPFRHYLRLRRISNLVALAGVAAVAIWGPWPTQTAWALGCVGLARAADSMSDLHYGGLQREHRLARVALSMALRGIAALASVSLALALGGGVAGAAAAFAAAWIVAEQFVDAPSSRRLLGRDSPLSNAPSIGALARTALPLGLVMALISLNLNIPRYFIEGLRGARDLGLFAAAAYLSQLGALVVNALGVAAAPRLAAQFTEGRRADFRASLLRLTIVALALGTLGLMVALAAGRLVLTRVYGTAYGEGAEVLSVLCAAAGLGYLTAALGCGVTASRQFKRQVLVLGAATLTTLIAATLLVPGRGILGAAWATLISSGVACAGMTWLLAASMSAWVPERSDEAS